VPTNSEGAKDAFPDPDGASTAWPTNIFGVLVLVKHRVPRIFDRFLRRA
jgi:hypothetical protein